VAEWHDVYEGVESVTDACEDVASVFTIPASALVAMFCFRLARLFL